MSTRSAILNLLNRQPLTVIELARELGLTRNSVHLQIGQLEAGGLVVRAGQRRGEGAGKPAWEYRAAAGAEDAFSTAYRPLLDALMVVLATELPAGKRAHLLAKTGESLALGTGLVPTGKLRVDLQKAVEQVNQLGAMAEITRDRKRLCVTSYSCPVAQLVRSESGTCGLVGSFFSTATGVPVEVACKRDENLVCRFFVARAQ